MSFKKVICAVDTSDLSTALNLVKRIAPYAGAFKIGHALTLAHGLDVIDQFQDAGAEKVFLDLKFHDIPNSVAVAVREAARRKVWMTTVHLTGGSEMLKAAMQEAKSAPESPLIVGVAVLTSIDQTMMETELGVSGTIESQFNRLGNLAVDCGLSGMVCSPHEVKQLRELLQPEMVIVTPGIRPVGGSNDDQKRVSDAKTVIADGAEYLVIGRALTSHPDPEQALFELGIR